MKVCLQCKKENPDDFKHCRYCGAELSGATKLNSRSFWNRLPSWAWILIIVGALIIGIGLIIGSFVALATIEGVASLVLLTLGMIGFGILPLRKPQPTGAISRAIGISFFALMGATVDQTGNYIYNKPVEICFCNDGTSLNRIENVSNPMPGTTIIQQDFTCYDKAGAPVKTINMFAVMGIRFVEYVLLGYILLGVRRFLWNVKNKERRDYV